MATREAKQGYGHVGTSNEIASGLVAICSSAILSERGLVISAFRDQPGVSALTAISSGTLYLSLPVQEGSQPLTAQGGTTPTRRSEVPAGTRARGGTEPHRTQGGNQTPPAQGRNSLIRRRALV